MKIAFHLIAMKHQENPTEWEDLPDRADRTALPDPGQEVIGWLLFIRHYGGNLRKYGGPSRTDRAAQA